MATYNIGSRSGNYNIPGSNNNNSSTPPPTGAAPPIPPNNTNNNPSSNNTPNNNNNDKGNQKKISDLLSIIKELNDQGTNLSQLAPKNIGDFIRNLQQFTSTLGEIQNTIKASAKIMDMISKINMSDAQIENSKRILRGLTGFNREIIFSLLPNIMGSGNSQDSINQLQIYNAATGETNKLVSTLLKMFEGLRTTKVTPKDVSIARHTLRNIANFNQEIIENLWPSMVKLGSEKVVFIMSAYSKLPGLIKAMVAESYALIMLLSGEESALGVAPDREAKGLKGFFKNWYIRVFKKRLQRKKINKARANLNDITNFMLEDVGRAVKRLKDLQAKVGDEKGMERILKVIEKISSVFQAIKAIAILVLTLPLFLSLAILVFPIVLLFLVAFVFMMKVLMWVIKFVPPANLAPMFMYISIVALLMVILAASFILLGKIADKAVEGLWKSLLFMGAMILFMIVMSLVALLIAKLSPIFLPMIYAIGVVVLVVGAILLIAGMLWLLQKINLDIDGVKDKVRGIIECVNEIIEAVFAPEKKKSEERSESSLGQMLSFVTGVIGKVIAGLGAAIYLVSAVFSVAAIILLGYLLRMIKWDPSLNDKIKQSVTSIIELVTFITDMVMYGKSKQAEKSEKDGGLLNSITELLSDTFNGIGKVVQGIASFGYLVFTLLSVGVLILLSKLLRSINFGTDEAAKAKEATKNILETINQINSDLNSVTDFGAAPQEGGLLGTVLGFFSPQLGGLVNALITMGTVIFLFVTIALIKGLGSFLTTLSDMNTTGIMKAAENAKMVVQSAKDILLSLTSAEVDNNASEEEGVWGWLKSTGKSLFSFVTGSLDILDGLLKIGQVAGLVVGIGLVVKLADFMKDLSEKAVTPSDLVPRVQIMMNSAQQIMSILTKNASDEDAANTTIKQLETTYKVYDALGKVVERINQIKVESGFDQSLSSVQKTQDLLASLSKISDKDVKNNERLANSYVKFFDKVDRVDSTKLKTTEKIMENWARLSESINGNFDKLADAFTEKLLPVIKELKDSLEKIDNTLGHSQEQAASIAAIQLNPGSANKETIAAAAGNTGNTGTNNKNIQAIEKAKKEAQKSKDKIEDLYRLFEEGDAIVKIKSR